MFVLDEINYGEMESALRFRFPYSFGKGQFNTNMTIHDYVNDAVVDLMEKGHKHITNGLLRVAIECNIKDSLRVKLKRDEILNHNGEFIERSTVNKPYSQEMIDISNSAGFSLDEFEGVIVDLLCGVSLYRALMDNLNITKHAAYKLADEIKEKLK